jgi:hypothetical protein
MWVRAVEAVTCPEDNPARDANLASAIERLADQQQLLTQAVNTVGAQVQTITDSVMGFAGKFAGMGPGQMVKAMMGGGRNGD